MAKRLQDRVCVITGAGSGIGRGTAVRFAEEGAQLVLLDVNELGLQETARQVGELAAPALTRRCDVSVKADVDAAVAETVARFGRLDVMFANAGVGGGGKPFLELTEPDWDKTLGVNLKGVAFCGQAAAREMVRLGIPGRIINTASTYAEVCRANTATYSASKGGVRMLTKVMAVELGPHSITVNAVGPGWIRTGMNPLTDPNRLATILPGVPLGRVGTPTDVAGAVLFLASDDGAYVTGTTIFVDGGWILQ